MPDGSAGLAYAVPTPGGGWVSSTTEQPVGTDVPVNPDVTPETDQTVQRPVIEVSKATPPGPGYVEEAAGTETKPGSRDGSDKAPKQPAPHEAAGLVERPDGTWGAPPPSDAKPAAPGGAAPTPDPPHAAAGLVEAPDGSFTTPERAAAMPQPKPPAAPGTPGTDPYAGQSMGNQPPLQWLHDAIDDVAGAVQSVRHGATMGFDEVVGPIPEAIHRSVTKGIPFTQAYSEVQSEMSGARHVFETNHPAAAVAAEGAGGVAPALLSGGLYAPVRAGGTVLKKAFDLTRNIAADAVQGGVAGFGQTEGDLSTRLGGAWEGAKQGMELGRVVPLARGVVRAVTPGAQADRLAGNVLTQQGVNPNVVPPKAPIEGFPLGVGGSSGDPKLAAIERQARELNDREARTQITDQNAAIKKAATEKVGATPSAVAGAKPYGGTQLSSGRMPAPEASSHVVEAMNDVQTVLKDESNRLWTKPTILGTQPDLVALKQRVDKEIGGMTQLTRREIANSTDLQDGLEHLATLEPGSSLRDVNDARSKILGVSRDPNQTPSVRRAAGELGKVMIDAIEANPALRNDPAAWRDYVQARNFTSRMADVLGHEPFQRMLMLNKFGNAGVDARTAASKVFGFDPKTAGERVPGGFDAINTMMNDVRRQWGALRNAGQTTPGTFNPATAQAAQAKLMQGGRDFIVNSMLDAAQSTVRDNTGEMGFALNSLSKWIDTNEGWMKKSGMFSQDQMDVVKAIRDSAVMGAFPDSARGGKNSTTYSLIMRDPKFIDLFVNPASRLAARVVSGAGGYVAGRFLGHEDIGALIGLSTPDSGMWMLQKAYGPAADRLRERVTEGIFDPEIARFLAQKATGANAKYMTPKVQNWIRSLWAQQTTGQTARIESMPEQPEGEGQPKVPTD